MDHTMHTMLNASDLTRDTVMGSTIYGADDAKIGSVSHVHGSGAAMEVIVDVGGFLGIGSKPVAIACSALTFMRDQDGSVHATTAWTRNQVKNLPAHEH